MPKKTKAQKNSDRRRARKAEVQFAHRMAKLPPPAVVLSWVAQGVNYLASDYETGVWDPVFDDVYENKTLTIRQMSEHILSKYRKELEKPDEWSTGKLLLAWVIADPELLMTYRKGALNKLLKKFTAEEAETLLLAPKQPDLWELFSTVKTSLHTKYA